MSLGFEQAGFDVVCSVEFDPAHAAAHRRNFPLCEVVQEDATTVTSARLKRGVREGLQRHGRDPSSSVDVVFGGPPCQGFSVGGHLDPQDPRNKLVEEFARLVVSLKPSAFVLENVPAMASRSLPGAECPVPEWLRRRFALAGYTVGEPEIFNANRYGLPQDRRRLLLVGVRNRLHAPVLPSPTHAARPKDPTRSPRPGELGHAQTHADLPLGPSVLDAIGDLPNLDDFERLLWSDSVPVPSDLQSELDAQSSAYARQLNGLDRDRTDLSWPRSWSRTTLTSSLRTVHTPAVVARFAAVAPGEREPISRFARLHPEGTSPTLRAGSTPDRGSYSAPRPIHPSENRVISVREAARLHGFPDWFRFTAAKWHGFRQVGNAVCPPLAKAVAESLREALDLPSIRPRKRLRLGRDELLLVPSGAGRSTAGKNIA